MSLPKIGNPSGGQAVSKGHSKKGISSTEEILKAIRDELDAIKSGSAITSPDAATQTAGYVQADVQSIATLANELKAKLNAISTALAKFEK